MKKHVIIQMLAVLLLSGGCDNFLRSYDHIYCPESVTATVQMANQPVISWDPACHAVFFGIYPLSPDGAQGPPVWELQHPNPGPDLYPPLTYSVKPKDIDQPTPALPLEVGRRYQVLVKLLLAPYSTRILRTEFIYAP